MSYYSLDEIRNEVSLLVSTVRRSEELQAAQVTALKHANMLKEEELKLQAEANRLARLNLLATHQELANPLDKEALIALLHGEFASYR